MDRVLIVDAANVVGSVPDGWWRDRAGAARRLRDSLVPVAGDGLPAVNGNEPVPGPLEVILVVEGAAKAIEPTAGVTVVSAPGSGDDTIVDLVKQFLDSANKVPDGDSAHAVVVVTADRGLRERVIALGALIVGPRSLSYSRRSG